MKYKIAFESLAIFSLVILVISAASSLNFVSDESSEIIPNAYALKAKGKFLTEINSKLVCGDRLCSEVDEEPLDELVVKGIGEDLKDLWSEVTETYDDVKSDIDETIEDVSGAMEIAKNEVRKAVDLVLDDVGKFSTERWSEVQKLSVEGFDIAKGAYEETKKDLDRIVNNIGKEGICAAYATMQCTK